MLEHLVFVTFKWNLDCQLSVKPFLHHSRCQRHSIITENIWYSHPLVQPQQNQMCHQQHRRIIQTRDLAVSRATVEGLRLLWQLRRRDVLCYATSQSSSQKKTMWLARTGEPFSRPVQSSLSRSSRPPVIWSGVRMLIKCIRLIEQIPVIWKSIQAQVLKVSHFVSERCGGGDGDGGGGVIAASGTTFKFKMVENGFFFIIIIKLRWWSISVTHTFFFPLQRVDVEIFTLSFPFFHEGIR